MHSLRLRFALLIAVALIILGCRKDRPPHAPLRVAAAPNVTHAQALVGHLDGTFERVIGASAFELKLFNAGPAAMEALLSGSIDAAYVGTGPAINAFIKGEKELRVIAFAADGGALLVTKGAKGAQELRGKKLAIPQVGNTQDIALRFWLKQNGLAVDKDVEVVSVSNPEIVALFKRGEIDGAWVPEPWGSRMLQAGGTLLLDERTLWPDGSFPATVLVTTSKSLQQRPEKLKALLQAHLELTGRWKDDPAAFAAAANQGFEKATSKPLEPEVLNGAFGRLSPSLRPDIEALKLAAEHAKAVGYLKTADVTGIVDTSLLDELRPEGPAVR